MIYVLSGGQTGATLTVTSSGAGTITVSNTTLGKSYSKSVTAGDSAVFKGLKTGTWTVKLTNGTQTSTKTVVITSDYSTNIAYFSASINITYPANSTCIVTDSIGQTVASDANTGTSTKTWTATVNAKGTYTVTATATDGSEKSKSQSVSITTEGQLENVALSYQLHLFKAGEGLASGYSIAKSGALTVSKGTNAITLKRSDLTTNGQAYFSPAIDCSQFTKLTVVAKQTEIYDMYGATLVRLLAGTTAEQNGTAAVSKKLNQSGATTCDFDLSAIDEVLYLNIGCFRGTSCEITNILFT